MRQLIFIVQRILTNRLVLAVLMFFLPQQVSAISPPDSGGFPIGFWEQVLKDSTALEYGDTGWKERFEQRRQTRRQIALGQTVTPLKTDNFHLPVLLGNYSDVAGRFTVQDFQKIFFGDLPSGSMADYFTEVSYGQFQLTGTVFDWVTLDETQFYYADDNYGNSDFPNSITGYFRDLVAKADPTVDFSLFDNDGPDGIPNSGDDDGLVDAVMVVHPGGGAETGDSDNLWSRQLSYSYTTDDLSANGGYIKTFAGVLIAELKGDGTVEEITPIGIPCHEFAHAFGLPDLYDRTDYEDAPDFDHSFGIGRWGLMGYGEFGGDVNHQETPTHMTAWSKIKLGWVTPVDISSSGTISIEQVESSPQVYRIREDNLWEDGSVPLRYFLVENRQQSGFDRHLKVSGLLIYHIDDNRGSNDDETHKLVDVEEADGRTDLDDRVNLADDGDLFPGSSGNRSFDNSSTPNSRDYEDRYTGVAIRNISDSAPTMTAEVNVRNPLGYVIAYDENGMTGRGWGAGSPADWWGGVLFTPEEEGALTAVEAGFRQGGIFFGRIHYEIEVYESFSGTTPEGLLSADSGYVDLPGWHTIPLTNAIALEKDQDFFVSLKIANERLGISYDHTGEISGRSYSSSDGVIFDNSISTSPDGGDINIRARIEYPAFLSSAGDVTFEDTTGNLEIWVILAEVLSEPVVDLLISRDGGVSYNDTVSCYLDLGRFTTTIPVPPSASVLNYFFEARDASGEIRRLPIEAPLASFTIQVISHIAGDVNNDQKIDIFDLLELLKQLGEPSQQNDYGDVDGNGTVDIFDLLSLLKKLSNN